MIVVSACLLGENCKYNGGNNFNQNLQDLMESKFKDKEIKLICPEVKGGLAIPRPPSEIVHGDGFDVLDGKALVMTDEGKDVSQNFINGIINSLEKIDIEDIDFAILKSKSPSCGSKNIYSGKFNEKLKTGSGVAAAFLIRNGINVYNENELDKILNSLY